MIDLERFSLEEIIVDISEALYRKGLILNELAATPDSFERLKLDFGCLLREGTDQKGQFIFVHARHALVKVYLSLSKHPPTNRG